MGFRDGSYDSGYDGPPDPIMVCVRCDEEHKGGVFSDEFGGEYCNSCAKEKLEEEREERMEMKRELVLLTGDKKNSLVELLEETVLATLAAARTELNAEAYRLVNTPQASLLNLRRAEGYRAAAVMVMELGADAREITKQVLEEVE